MIDPKWLEAKAREIQGKTCKDCKFCECLRLDYSNRLWYGCRIRRDNRNYHGIMHVKARQKACGSFKQKES